MRIYLVVIDESPEAGIALRFAARRAVKPGALTRAGGGASRRAVT